LGPLLVCARGVALDGQFTADPAAEVRLSPSGRELFVGRHRFDLARRIPDGLPEEISRWLRFRVETLLPFIEGYLELTPSEAVRRALAPFCRRCRTCGTIAAVAAGSIGRAIPEASLGSPGDER
jgi:hypothetical protein